MLMGGPCAKSDRRRLGTTTSWFGCVCTGYVAAFATKLKDPANVIADLLLKMIFSEKCEAASTIHELLLDENVGACYAPFAITSSVVHAFVAIGTGVQSTCQKMWQSFNPHQPVIRRCPHSLSKRQPRPETKPTTPRGRPSFSGARGSSPARHNTDGRNQTKTDGLHRTMTSVAPKPNHPALHKTIHPDDAATKRIETLVKDGFRFRRTATTCLQKALLLLGDRIS